MFGVGGGIDLGDVGSGWDLEVVEEGLQGVEGMDVGFGEDV